MTQYTFVSLSVTVGFLRSFSLCICNINANHPIGSDNYQCYLHITIGLLAPGCHGSKSCTWCNGWANTHLAYMKYTQRWKPRGRMIMLIKCCISEAVPCKQWLYIRKELAGCKHFLLQDSFIPPAPAAENMRKAHKPMSRNTAEHCNEQIEEKAWTGLH